MAASEPLPTFDLLRLAPSGRLDGPPSSSGAATSPLQSFELEATDDLCTPFGFMYGGTGIAASVEASERATGRPLQWITTQFAGSPSPGDRVRFEVDVAVTGRASSQTRITGMVGNEVVLASLAAHNVRPAGDETSFGAPPEVPDPDDCPDVVELFERPVAGSFFDHFERRVASGAVGHAATGFPQQAPLVLWCRMTSGSIDSAAVQAFVADLGPMAVCAALGVAPGGTSLDNTVRVVDTRPTEWVKVEIVADGFSRSVGHSTARLWSSDGRLLAIAQQSAIIRTSHHG
ncbi:MAG: acyl-CoA thioesterase [Ilumatobacter sp.]